MFVKFLQVAWCGISLWFQALSSWSVVTQLFLLQLPAWIPGQRWDVSTHPSSEKIYVTLLSHFLGTWPGTTSVCASGGRHIHVRVASGLSAARLLPSLLFRQWLLSSVYLWVRAKDIPHFTKQLATHMSMCVFWLLVCSGYKNCVKKYDVKL